jgi:hypothetical protein
MALFITSIAHIRSVPEIWTTSVYAVPWFVRKSEDLQPLNSEKTSKMEPSIVEDSSNGGCRDNWGRLWPGSKKGKEEDIETRYTTAEKGKGKEVPWTDRINNDIRRGIDDPFASPTARSSPTGSSLLLPLPDAHTKDAIGRSDTSRYVENFRDSTLPPIPSENPLSYYGLYLDGVPHVDEVNVFPKQVINPDKPIPLPRLSEWIRADTAKGINVHTVPPISP